MFTDYTDDIQFYNYQKDWILLQFGKLKSQKLEIYTKHLLRYYVYCLA